MCPFTAYCVTKFETAFRYLISWHFLLIQNKVTHQICVTCFTVHCLKGVYNILKKLKRFTGPPASLAYLLRERERGPVGRGGLQTFPDYNVHSLFSLENSLMI